LWNTSVNARPMPAAPAVIKTRCPLTDISIAIHLRIRKIDIAASSLKAGKRK
jgi:hypothetical protein